MIIKITITIMENLEKTEKDGEKNYSYPKST